MAGFSLFLTELVRETSALSSMATRFLDSRTTWSLLRLRTELEGIRARQRGCTLRLEDLRTIPSVDYEPGRRRGGEKIYAVISGIWELQPLGPARQQNREIGFCGLASTRVELRGSTGALIGTWSMELGDANSPGCFVHAHILNKSVNAVPIPRLPSLFVTPMSVIEFVLGELFQDRWAMVVGENNHFAQYWRAQQRRRLKKLFSWFQDQLEATVSSPWVALKEAKPQGYYSLSR